MITEKRQSGREREREIDNERDGLIGREERERKRPKTFFEEILKTKN